MQVGVIGLNHKCASLPLREKFAKACQKHFEVLSSCPSEIHFVLLSTCNRVELYFSSNDLTDAHRYLLQTLRISIEGRFEHQLYSFFGIDCFRHLSRVTAGIDSAILAETEIQGQVKRAYEAYAGCLPLPSDIHFMFQKSLRLGKQVRSQLEVKPYFSSVESIVYRLANNFSPTSQQNVLFIGASEINQQIMHFFEKKGLNNLTLSSRVLERAKEFVEGRNIKPCNWNIFHRLNEFNVIIVGTKYSHYLIHKDNLPYSNQFQLIIDLSIPRNVDPTLSKRRHLTLFNVDQINRMVSRERKVKQNEIQKAEWFIEQSIQRYLSIFKQKTQNPLKQLNSVI